MELPRNELPVSEYFDFTTQHKKEADYMGKNANRYHKIFPNGKDSWNFRLLATFINEFELEPGDCRSYNDKVKNYCYFSFYFRISSSLIKCHQQQTHLKLRMVI